MARKILLSFLCCIMGLVFMVSGYTKGGFGLPYSSPIEPFEYTFADLGLSWQLAPFIARLMIAFEFAIGLMLLFNLNLKLTYKLAIGTLVVFCVYLILLMALAGNNGNCGCFGDTIHMTPMQALIKNIVMLGLFGILWKYHEGWTMPKNANWLVILAMLITLAFPFIRNPIELNYSEAYLNRPEENFTLELDSLYNHAEKNIPPKTLSQGKHLIAFMSMTCPHCRIAAKKMRVIHDRNPEIPMYLVLNGKDEKIKPFFDDTKTDSIPWTILNGRNFVYLAGTNLPRIYLLNNSVVEHDLNYFDMDQGEIENWLGKSN